MRATRHRTGSRSGRSPTIPFPDATPEFFGAMARAMSLGLGRALAIATPLVHLHKEDVIRLGRELGVPLELTMSCMNPGGR